MKTRVFLPALGLINALGSGTDEVARGLFAGDTSGMILEDGWLPGRFARVGRARGALPEMPAGYSEFASRNIQLLLAALIQIENEVEAILTRFGRQRIGVVLGTSTSGIAEGEAAIAALRQSGTLPENYRYTQQELGAASAFLARYLGLGGPTYTISTACTSSAKAFASARTLLQLGLCDAVLVGGVDSLCRLTLNGFDALDSISSALCNPLSRHRSGINIGEGAALFIMSRDHAPIEFLGVGETSDAHHMSAPHPQGLGAEAAMRTALADAGVEADEIDYLNLHATATPKNDEMECRAVARVFPHGLAISGTKPLTGHTLGTAGAMELALCCLALRAGRLPPHRWDGQVDAELPRLELVSDAQTFRRSYGRACMSNSFAFGGSNACLIVGDAR